MGRSATDQHRDRHRAQAVAAAARRQAAERDVCLPPDLRIWSLVAGEDRVARGDGDDHGVGPNPSEPLPELPDVLEDATSTDQRRVNGLFVTPAWLADKLVELAFDGLDSTAHGASPGGLAVCDPACGGGAFLLAAARALHARGVPRRDVVGRCLWGADIDPVGLAAAEAALAVWSGVKPPDGRLVVGDALASGAGLWYGGTCRPPPNAPSGGVGDVCGSPFDAAVGNPPFLSQLAAATSRSQAERDLLRQRFGDAVQPYTDPAWLFLLLGCELVKPGGRVAFVQPLSLVAARDATAVRAALDRGAELRQLWVPDRSCFAANVRVCCPVLQRRPTPVTDVRGPGDDGPALGPTPLITAGEGRTQRGAPDAWADRLADIGGVPRVDLRSSAVLGDRADVIAGFRDEYYGLVPLVHEADDAPPVGAASARPLITAGVLDWGRSAWGERPSRFASRPWVAPVVDTTHAADHAAETTRRGKPAARAAAWLDRTAVPKVVVATQTRIVEAAVDMSGAWVPSVPTLAVLPDSPDDLDDLWLLAAAIASPAATAWLLRRAPGTALAAHAMRITARDLADLPLPSDLVAWNAAADAFRAYALAVRTEDASAIWLDTYCAEIARAYQVPSSLESWWRERPNGKGARDDRRNGGPERRGR